MKVFLHLNNFQDIIIVTLLMVYGIKNFEKCLMSNNVFHLIGLLFLYSLSKKWKVIQLF